VTDQPGFRLDRVPLSDSLVRAHPQDSMLPALDEALERLEALDMSPATLKRRFALVRAWVFRELDGGHA
jgi:hypothetical protein